MKKSDEQIHADRMKDYATFTETTAELFREIEIDYRYADSDMWSSTDKANNEKLKKPCLTFNEISPSIDLLVGVQAGSRTRFIASPRGGDDKRLSEVMSGALLALTDFTRLTRENLRVFRDGLICGLGVWELSYVLDGADDVLWGDINVSRLAPTAYIWDHYASRADKQDGAFMGKREWLTESQFKQRYPKHAFPDNAQSFQSSSGMLGRAVLTNFWDEPNHKVAVLHMWWKKMETVYYIVNEETSEVLLSRSKKDADETIERLVTQMSRQEVDQLQVEEDNGEWLITDGETGQIASMKGLPQVFLSEELAQRGLKTFAAHVRNGFRAKLSVISRRTLVPYFAEMDGTQVLRTGRTPYRHNLYPYVPYISNSYSDNPKSIQGVVRQNRDRQDEINKRYSNLLAHLNSSAHSGWLNRKKLGANPKELQMLGAGSGIVVEYVSSEPRKIEPSQISQGHFGMVDQNIQGIQRNIGVNAELIGSTTQATVSGAAINARQQGGLAVTAIRRQNFIESMLDHHTMLLKLQQQYYTPEKLKRIIGAVESKTPLGAGGQSLFQGKSEDEVLSELARIQEINFDLVLEAAPSSATERQAAFETGVQLIGLLISTGRQPGPATLEAITSMSSMDSKLQIALTEDYQRQPESPGDLEGSNKRIQNLIGSQNNRSKPNEQSV